MGPIGTTIGERYRLKEVLGRGGMGIVYRAHDTALDRDVAVKVLSGTNLGKEASARLLREAKIVAQLDHPNIVTVYDVGEYQGSPFIIMQLLDGCTLRDRRPNSLNETLYIITQVCAALEHAHRQGIIHRDLKPENVAISTDGAVRLMDFGLARPLASRLTAQGAVIGTVHYMAPEQLLGKELDQRADLYALGVMFYELTTGRLPFDADNPVAIITQHLNAPVVPPRARDETLPIRLDRLILKLLEKDRDSRPESASAVLQMLEEPESLAEMPEANRELSLLDRIVRGRLVGREQELAETDLLWRRATQGQGQLLLISGEPGIGKTRLVREIITRVEVTGGETSVGECYREGGAPYAPFAQMIHHWLRSEPGYSWLGGEEVPIHVLATLLTLTPDLQPRFPNVCPNPPLEAKLEQQRLFESMASLVQALGERAPVFLVVEDAQWADSGSLAMLRYLIRRLRRRPILLVATYREVELDEDLPLNQLLMELDRERLAIRMKLMRLNLKETKDLLATLFAADITSDFASGIYRETEGNPFFVEEVCKALVASGQLTYIDGAWQRPPMAELTIPQSIRIAIQSRVAHLREKDQELLRLAGLLGREFDFDTLVSTSKFTELAVIDGLEAAERAQLIEELSAERGGSFRFTHALIPTTLIESLSGLRRRRLHGQIAETMERLWPEEFGALAYHWGQAADDEKALKYHTLASEQASNAYANQEAERHLRAALMLAPEPNDEAHLLVQLGRVVARQGNHEEAVAIFRRGITSYELLGDLDQAANLYALSAMATVNGGNPKQGLLIAQTGLDVLKDAPDGPGLAELMRQNAASLLYEGEQEKGEVLARKSLRVAERVGALRTQIGALRILGTFTQLPQNEKVELLERAVQLAVEHKLPAEEAPTRNNLGIAYGAGLGQWERAIEQVGKASKLARMIGDRSTELHFEVTIVWFMIMKGDLGSAAVQLSRLKRLSDEIGETGAARNLLEVVRAGLARYLGQQQSVIERLREVNTAAVEVHDTNVIYMSTYCLVELLLETDQNLEEAQRTLEKALELGYGSVSSLHSLHAIVSTRRGELNEAAQHLEQADRIFRKLGDLTDEPFLYLAEAELARKHGQQGKVLDCLEKAAASFDECGMRWYRAFTLLQLADAMKASHSDDYRSLLEKAGDEFAAIGSLIYAEEARARLRLAQAGN